MKYTRWWEEDDEKMAQEAMAKIDRSLYTEKDGLQKVIVKEDQEVLPSFGGTYHRRSHQRSPAFQMEPEEIPYGDAYHSHRRDGLAYRPAPPTPPGEYHDEYNPYTQTASEAF